MRLHLAASTLVLGLATLVLATGTAQARDMEGSYSRAFNVCQKRALSNVEIGGCYDAELKRWDDDLNATYRQLMARLAPRRQSDLRNDERDWISGRDARCRRAGDRMGGGSGTGIAILSCTLDETIRRVQFLKNYR